MNKPNRSNQIKNTDSAMSLMVRTRAADSHSRCRCVTCGRSYLWRRMDNGHFISRTCKRLRWDEENTAPQCTRCNKWGGGMFVEFENYLRANGISKEKIEKWKELKVNDVWKPPMDWLRSEEIRFLLEAEKHASEKYLELNSREKARIRLAKKELEELHGEKD